jgi:hypothetical protein
MCFCVIAVIHLYALHVSIAGGVERWHIGSDNSQYVFTVKTADDTYTNNLSACSLTRSSLFQFLTLFYT